MKLAQRVKYMRMHVQSNFEDCEGAYATEKAHDTAFEVV